MNEGDRLQAEEAAFQDLLAAFVADGCPAEDGQALDALERELDRAGRAHWGQAWGD